MFSWINSANIYQRPAIVYNVTYSDDLEFIRPEVATVADPYVVLREHDFSEGTLPTILPYYKEVVTSSKNETGTLLVGVYPDPSNSSRLLTVEAFTSREYLDVHTQSWAYQVEQSHSWAIENGTEYMNLKMKGGFLYKRI